MRVFRIYAVSAAIAAASCLPDTAQAQYACGVNGPGPGEIVVGQAPGGGGVVGPLLCQYVGGDDSSGDSSGSPSRAPSRPTRPSKPGFMVAAYHADTGSVWTSAGHQTADGARRRALDACDAATGGGCYIAETLDRAGTIFVSEDAMGQLWIKADADNRKAPRSNITQWNPSIELCLKNAFGCKFLGFHQSGIIYLDEDPAKDQSWNRFPKGKLNQKRWAMVAQPKNLPGATPGKSWLVSGKQGSVVARKEVLDRCQKESGGPCAISAYAAYAGEMAVAGRGVGNGLLVHLVDARGKNRWTSAASNQTTASAKKGPKALPDPVKAQERVDRLCPPKLPCKIIATYDAATPRIQVIEDAK